MKNIIHFIFLLVSSMSFAQRSVPDSVQERYQDLKKLYYDYKIEASEPNKYFLYRYKDKNDDYFIHLNRKKYDSLTAQKLPDSVIIKKSMFIKKDKDVSFFFYTWSLPKDNYMRKVQNNKIIEEWRLSDTDNTFSKYDYLNFTYEDYNFNDNSSPILYIYKRYKGFPFDGLTGLEYEKKIYKDGTTKIFDYRKDFPLSDEEVLKRLPKLFADQVVELLQKDRTSAKITKKEAKSIAAQMTGAINKIDDNHKFNYKFELNKGYSNDDPTKPMYGFVFAVPIMNFWKGAIDVQAEKLLKLVYGNVTYD